jgi:CBS domain containing-hemolysin-like protein
LDTLLLQLAVLAVLILFSAFFNSAEAALFSLGRSSVSRLGAGSPAGRRVASLLSRPRRLLITILVGNLVANTFAASLATSTAIGVYGEKGVGIAFGAMSFLILMFGEVLPKVIAVHRAERLSLLSVYPLAVFYWLFIPLRWPAAAFSNRVIDFIKRRLGSASRHLSKDEILTALDAGLDAGQFGDFEHELLTNILEFRETTVKEIATPSIDVVSFPASLGVEEMLDRVAKSGHSRVLVYGEGTDDIQGVVHVKDLARIVRETEDPDLSDALMPPFYIPEAAKISSLFDDLAREKLHIAVVIDEHGSFVGIVTMEDILEEIVGEIRDSKEPVTSEYTLMPDGRIVVLGSMEIEEFNSVFETSIVDDEHETIAGYVMGAIGKIPSGGETVDVGRLRFHIISSQPNRIRKMRVEKL